VEATARFWIGVAAQAHVARGVRGGFCMFAHGKHDAVKRVRPGDWVAYYSPRTEMNGGEEVRAFTAVGRVKAGEPYQVAMAADRLGWRRDVDYLKARQANIYPLLEQLSFIKDRAHWGMVFRRGLFEAPRADFALIAEAMGLDPQLL
jgi:hypothetical protein